MDILFNILKWIIKNIFRNSNSQIKYYVVVFLFILLATLTACGPVQATPPVTKPQVDITTVTDVLTQSALTKAVLPTVPTATSTVTRMPTAPPLELPTYVVIPTQTPEVTPLVNKPFVDAWRTQFALETPVRTPVTLVKNEKLPKVYVEEENLYFQNNSSQSIQLTNSGKDRAPILSDDGKKITFYRGETSDNLYLINSDGSQEQAIITSETPPLVGKGEIKSPTFVPGTHLLLFNTYLCGPRKGLYDYPDCIIGVYSLNTDTGKINIVAENISGNSMRDSNFEISPDGKYVSVVGEGHINIYHLSSGQFKIAYPNVLTYYVTPPDEYLPKQYWFTDSSGLIIISAADNEYNEPAGPPSSYFISRYTFDLNDATQAPPFKFYIGNPSCLFSVSPDRNWLYFSGYEKEISRELPKGYLVNLNTGDTILYGGAETCGHLNLKWSPDSIHFTTSFALFGVIGAVNGPPLPVGGYFIDWIDATHYYYMVIDNAAGTNLMYKGEIDDK